MINTYNESTLHAQIKQWYKKTGDETEKEVDGYIVDLVRRDHLIEVQTANFSSIKRKLQKLLRNHKIILVYPIAFKKWILQLDAEDNLKYRRKSPRIGRPVDVFSELIRIPELMNHPNFTLEILLCEIEELRRDDGKGSRRRGGKSITDRKLLNVVQKIRLEKALHVLELLPSEIKEPFSARDLAGLMKVNLSAARRIAYSLRKMEILNQVGKRGNAYLYRKIKTDYALGDHYNILQARLPEKPSVIGKDNYSHSVVLVPFVEIDKSQFLLFQKRSAKIKQPGEICFPGGGVEAFKINSLEATALRETREELGISREKIEIGGYLGHVINPQGAYVDVFAGKLNITALNELNINRKEVDQAFLVPVDFFLKNDPVEYNLEFSIHSIVQNENGEEQELFPAEKLGLPQKYWRTWSGRPRKVYVYKFEDKVIWGLTAEIVRSLINLINLY